MKNKKLLKWDWIYANDQIFYNLSYKLYGEQIYILLFLQDGIYLNNNK
jgi:hypothetical protein